MLSAATAEVEFSDFDLMEKIAVVDIPGRLHPEDPRLDRFLRTVGDLFWEASGQEQLIYLPARLSPPVLTARIRRVLPGKEFTILEWQGTRRFLLLLFFIALGSLTVFREKKNRILYGAFALPWLSLLHSQKPGTFAAGILVYGLNIALLEEALPFLEDFLYQSGSSFSLSPRLQRGLYRTGGLLLISLLFLPLTGGFPELLPFLFGLGGTAALGLALFLFRLDRQRNREHRLFIPRPILPRQWQGKESPYRAKASLVILLLLLVLPLIFRATGTGSCFLVPEPYHIAGLGGMNRETLRDLWFTPRGEKLPDFSDYLSHRAYQQGFFHGHPQTFPESDGALTLSRFSATENGILRREEVVENYDESWYKNELKAARESALGALLYAQGPRGITLKTAGGEKLGTAYCLGYGLFVTLGCIPLLLLHRRGGFPRGQLFLSMASRRKRQPA